jgi:hypothetical protein
MVSKSRPIVPWVLLELHGFVLHAVSPIVSLKGKHSAEIVLSAVLRVRISYYSVQEIFLIYFTFNIFVPSQRQ